MSTNTTETTMLPGDRDALTFKDWEGVRGLEWSGFDHLIGMDVEHCRTKGEARKRLLAQRKAVLDEHRDPSPEYVETARARLSRHRKAFDASKAAEKAARDARAAQRRRR